MDFISQEFKYIKASTDNSNTSRCTRRKQTSQECANINEHNPVTAAYGEQMNYNLPVSALSSNRQNKANIARKTTKSVIMSKRFDAKASKTHFTSENRSSKSNYTFCPREIVEDSGMDPLS